MTGIEVKTEVVLDHWELGRAFAEWDSDKQALFLHGLATGISELKGAGPLQLHYIVGALIEAEGTYFDDVKLLVERLVDYFKEPEA